MRRVLLTGATGFVGSQVVDPLLERGFEIHALAKSPPLSDARGVTWHAADLLDANAAAEAVQSARPSHLLHLAWYTEHGSFWHAPENLDWVGASLGLIRAFQATGGERVVVAGTCAEYDWSSDCCDERTRLRPATLYGISKNALREILQGLGSSVGLSVAWGRIFFTFGPRERPARLVASAARALIEGEPLPCSPGTHIRDFLYVEDVAAAFAALLDSKTSGAVDIGSGEARSLREVLESLERLAGRQHLLRFGEVQERDEPRRIVADVSRLRSELGWRPTYTLEEGLERTLAWWRQELDAAPSGL